MTILYRKLSLDPEDDLDGVIEKVKGYPGIQRVETFINNEWLKRDIESRPGPDLSPDDRPGSFTASVAVFGRSGVDPKRRIKERIVVVERPLRRPTLC